LRVIGATAATRTSREERRKTTIKPCGTRKQQPTTGIQQLTPIANPDVERPQETFNNYIVIQLYYVLFRPNLEDLEMFLVYPCDYIHTLYAHYTHQYYTMLYIHILIIHTYIHSNTYICTSMYVYIYIHTLRARHQECIFHMRMRPQKWAMVAAPFEHKPTDSQMHSPLPNCEETNCNRLCLGRHVARKQARGVEPLCGQTPRRPRYLKLLLLKPACK